MANAFPYNDAIRNGSSAAYRQALGEEAAAHRPRRCATGSRASTPTGCDLRITANPSPAHALHDLAEAEHAELVVVGSSHTGRLGRVAPGSTAERLLHGAPCAVAVVPHGYRTRAEQPIRRIGVAYDGSAEATAAVAAGVELARALSAELEVIGVTVPDTYTGAGDDRRRRYIVPLEELERGGAGGPRRRRRRARPASRPRASGSPATPPTSSASTAPAST